MSRVRRCSWEIGVRCHAPATRRVKVTYLGQPIDRDPLMCDAHADMAQTLIRPGWAIVRIEPLVVMMHGYPLEPEQEVQA